jgi:N-methylhydantoinase B
MPAQVIDGCVMDGIGNGYVPTDELNISPTLPIWDRERPALDPVTYEVIRHNLWNVNEEHGSAIIKVSGSPIASFGRDFNPCIMDAHGDFIFFGPYLQFHAGMQDLSVKWILENRSENPGIFDGDMFIHNDPWVGTCHQQDAATMCPIFWEDELFCWVGSTLHFPDLGGPTPGGWCPAATSVFDEPVPMPPVKIVERGTVRRDLEEMWKRRSRMPDAVGLDLRAVIAGNNVARDRVLALIRRYGPGTVKAVMERIVDDAEQAFLAKLADVPDGVWSAQSFVEIAGPGDRKAYRGTLTITKEGNTLTFSNRGTDPQVGALSVAYAGWRGGILSVVNPLLCYDSLFAIGGALRHIKFDPQPGTLTCASYPASVSNGGGVGVELSLALANDALVKLMACSEALRQELTCVTGTSIWPTSALSGTNQWGEYFSYVLLDFFDASMGAQTWRDGIHTSGTFWGPLQIAPNVEETEQANPILYLRRQELRDSAAGGKYIGGSGSVVTYVAHGTDQILHQFAAAGVAIPTSTGAFGGQPGIPNGFRIKRKSDLRTKWFANGRIPREFDEIGGELHLVRPQESDFVQTCDDVYEIWCCTGGAWGDPLDRDPIHVARDVSDGYCSRDEAERLYGTVLAKDGTVDEKRSKQCRNKIYDARLGTREGNERRGQGDAQSTGDSAEPTQLLRVGEYLIVVHDADGAPRFHCRRCHTDLGAVSENYKAHCVARDRDVSELGPLFPDPSYFIDDAVRCREHYCPGCATLLQTDIVRATDPLLHDIALVIPHDAELS